MAKRGKNYIKVKAAQPKEQMLLAEGIESIRKLSYSKFPGTLELHLALKLPKDTDPKSLKGSLSLPHSLSTKDVKVAVFTSPEREEEAKKAGATFTNLEELIKDIKSGKIEFDVAIATPDVMPKIASIGKELGPRGLMPNPKTGTVTENFAEVVAEYKKGKINFKSDLTGVMHFNAGKLSLDTEKLIENVMTCVNAAADILNKRPDLAVKKAHIAPTMGPSISVTLPFEKLS